MKISKEKIQSLSNQIYLGLTEEETQKLCEDIGQIAEEMQTINKIDVEGINPDIAVLEGQHNAFRKDEVVEYTDKEALLQNAKETEDDMFKIPRIV
ncbi:MAG: Asp-tRNA(Asn)/Glu-tRNA(Gln) amidotransferase subunit GatC [Oscillospiraceae bacterium]|nr:Asp-tRNA(Asn)/Glu-tRNA(Gln) amidotransferase subunit GatC [Oscillospiraceae bacterium]